MNLLIVDDEMLEVAVIEKMIDKKKLGIDEIHKAYSMNQAIEVIQSHNISILLSDIEMPKGSGLRLIEWVRAQSLDIIPIFLTSHAVFQYAQKALSLRVTEYLLKPVERSALECALAEAVELARPFQVKKSPEIISQVKAYIEENMDREISRTEIAEAVHLHPDYLSHFFKEKTGLSISDYITEVRMEHAKTLLLTTEDSISSIALQSGYPNIAYFSKMFKRATGMTPSKYRQMGAVKK